MSGTNEPDSRGRGPEVSILKEPKTKSLTIRIDDIPNDQADELETNLTSIVKEDALLHQAVARLTPRSVVPWDEEVACATVTFETSLSAEDLVNRLHQIGDDHPYTYSHTFDGFTPLYQSPNGATVDIVAVPGLGSHALGSWKAPNSHVVWLRDFLPKDQPNARILLYGYNTTLKDSVNKQSIEELGHTLLEEVIALRTSDDTSRRPIIFIAHSLGGLLIKELLIRAVLEKNEDESDLSKSCFGLLFFGVPNHGLRNETLNAVVQGQPNEALIRDLQVGKHGEPSSFLAKLSSLFSQSCKGRYQVVSFYELELSPTLKIGGDGIPRKTGEKSLLVTKESATSTGIVAVADEDNIALRADHSGLVKFDLRRRGCYPIVISRLKKLTTQATSEVPKRFANPDPKDSPSPLPAVTQSCLKSLAFTDMDSRHHDIKRATEHTCEWLRGHETFQGWIRLHRGLLWIAGHPGSGKSTLMKHARQLGQEVYGPNTLMLSFFFHARGHELQKSLLGLFRSLLHQLLCEVPEVLPEAIEYFRRQKQTVSEVGGNWEWHLHQLQDYFQRSLPKIVERRPLVLFIDALDEAGEEAAVDLIEFMSKQLDRLPISTGSQFSVCFSCRYYPVIMLEEGLEIHLKNENEGDITTFVQERLYPRVSDPNIRQLVSSRAQGSFMWARLACDRVLQLDRRGEPPRRIKAEIERLPEKLDEIYRELMQAAEDRQQTLKLMQWICCSEVPLTISELQWAMAVNADVDQSLQECQDSDNFIAYDRVERRVKVLSCGLVEFVEFAEPYKPSRMIFQFIHQSVKDFFIRSGLFLLDDTIQTDDTAIPTAHCRLARCCIRCLRMVLLDGTERFKSEEELLSCPLSVYTLAYFAVHLRNGEAAETYSRELLTLFDWPKNTLIQRCEYAAITLRRELPTGISYSKDTQLAHVASKYGLTNLLSYMLLDGRELDIEFRAEGRTPLSLACESGYEGTVKLLLETGRCDTNLQDDSGRTPLSWAADYGREEVVKLLLEIGKVEVDLQDSSGRTPLSWAAKRGREEVVKLLLETGKVEVDLQDSSGRTPLSWATANRYGGEEVVKLLLETGKVEVDLQDSSGRTPLSWATANRYRGEEVVKLLLETGKVEVNLQDSSGRTPLSRAAEYNGWEVVKLLLKTGKVEVDLQDSSGRTPLSWAASANYIGTEVAQLLLETGKVEVDLQDSSGRTPLSWAASTGYREEVFKLLLETGKVEVDLQDSSGRTPLSWAAERGKEEVAKLLLETGKVEVNRQDSSGRTPLSWAAQYVGGNVLKLLLETGKVEVDLQDSSGRTPLSRAAEYSRVDAVKLLLETGKVEVDLQDSSGRTPLSRAAEHGREEVVKLLLETGKVEVDRQDSSSRTPLSWAASAKYRGAEVVQLLIETGKVEVDLQDSSGRTPLSWAAEYNGLEVVKLLLETGKVEVDLQDSSGRTPLSWAAEYNGLEVVKLLLETGKVEVDLQDSSGRTPLSWAAEYNGLEVVKLLLETGKVEVNLQDSSGRTPLSWAAEYNGLEVVRLLLETGKVEADLQDSSGRTPLSWAAAEYGGEKVVQLLLETGKVEVDLQDSSGRTPLSWAFIWRRGEIHDEDDELKHLHIIKQLLETNRADASRISADDMEFWTAQDPDLFRWMAMGKS